MGSKSKAGKTGDPSVDDGAVIYHGFRERERKFEFSDGENSHDRYKKVFKRVRRNSRLFPTLSSLFKSITRADGSELKVPRPATVKDLRVRTYYSDKGLKIVDNNIEIRREQAELVIKRKHVNGANGAQPHTLDRDESKVPLKSGQVHKLRDIWGNCVNRKKIPGYLRKIFKGNNVNLYPMVTTRSWRSKFNYYHPVSYKGKDFVVELEFAWDTGTATPVLGDPYDIDQFEVEVKRVIDAQSETDILEHPERLGLTDEEVNREIVEPVMEKQEQVLANEYGLKAVYDSKPAKGFQRVREELDRKGAHKAIRQARDTGQNMWGGLQAVA